MPLMTKTSNPAFGSKAFQDVVGRYGGAIDAADRMTLNGTVNRTGILLVCALATAWFTWNRFLETHDPAAVGGLLMLGMFGGLITAMVTIFKQTWAPITAPIYALMQGLFLGGVSAVLELRYPGIAIQAVGLTFGVLLMMLLVYRSGLIRVSNKFRIGIIAATGGIALFYLAEMILGFFHINFIAINGGGPIGIGFSLFVCAIAALNLVLDFDFIERGVNAGAPKYMEWYGAFGIMVTLVWLYLEILRLLSKIRSRQ
jgi:uncharacterized YccA/Bax inhibitor family protein